MNLKLLRAELRAVRRASLRLTQHSLSLVGLVAIAAVGVFVMHPDLAQSVGALVSPPAEAARTTDRREAPFTAAIAAPGSEASRLLGLSAAGEAPSEGAPTAVVSAEVGTGGAVAAAAAPVKPRERREAVAYLSHKYRVNSDAIAMLVDAAYATGRELDLDPLLLLSVMAVESGFNPFAESTAGASGLMQLMSKVHADKLADFGGAHIALNPVVNLRVGAAVLKDCIHRGGSIADGLRLYVGAGNNDDAGYGSRVLQEKDRLAQAVRGLRPKIEPVQTTTAATTAATTVVKARGGKPEQIDHSLDTADPTDPKVDAAAGRVAAL